MAVASLIVRNGVGSWGDIAHLITRGLDLGAVAAVWTSDTPPTTTWHSDTAPSNVWTNIANPTTTWTKT